MGKKLNLKLRNLDWFEIASAYTTYPHTFHSLTLHESRKSNLLGANPRRGTVVAGEKATLQSTGKFAKLCIMV